MSKNINTIVRLTKRGCKRKLIEANGDANWRKAHPESLDLRATGISCNSSGDVEFRFSAPASSPHEYVVTLTALDIQRAVEILRFHSRACDEVLP